MCASSDSRCALVNSLVFFSRLPGVSWRAHVCYCAVRDSPRCLQTPHSCVCVSDCSICLLQPRRYLQVSFWQISTFKCPLLPSPSINPPKMSPEIKRHPPPEYRQLKTIHTTASTSSSCAGGFYVSITTRTCTGPLKTILSRGSKLRYHHGVTVPSLS